MKQLKHTPIPWEIVDDEITLNIREKSTGYNIAFVYRELEENARLISCCPEMLEALIEAYYIYEDVRTDDIDSLTLQPIKIIIEKATGMKIEEVVK